MPHRILLLLTAFLFCFQSHAQTTVVGTVTDVSGPIPFAHVNIEGSNIGAFTNDKGEFRLVDIPEDKHLLRCSYVGYRTSAKEVNLVGAKESIVHFKLTKTSAELDEVVVTGSRTEQLRSESVVNVGVIDKQMLQNVQANTLADGLNFQSGLRMETDCQTCGYSQLRMNGLGGAYSLILIDSRPIFSSMMGLYGLEQIPANTIERIEVVRGGGSAIYGSNAIAGTVNVITKEPSEDMVEAGVTVGLIDAEAMESKIDAVVSKVFDRSGFTLNVNRNNREPYDANGDGFSEMPKLKGLNVGLSGYRKIGKYAKLSLNLNSINEYRRGGNKIDSEPHEADQAEDRMANIIMGDISLNNSLPNMNSSFNIYIAGQQLKRDHYTGIDHADAYGNTLGQTLMGGLQYNYFTNGHTITVGSEYIYDFINDDIPLYNYLIDQQTRQFGGYIQDEWKINNLFTVLGGFRLDKHNMLSHSVFNPRLSVLFNPWDFTQLRVGYSSGFRAPQAFDTDLHIAFASGGISLITLDPALQEETSKSYTMSINYDRPTEAYIYGFTIETFYTRLFDAFVLEENGRDNQGNLMLLKKNGGGSTVQGVSLEGRFNYNSIAELSLGATYQNSRYDQPVKWSPELEGSTTYLRTPDLYGFYTLDLTATDRIDFSLSGVYTGSMLVPHFGGAPGVLRDEVITSETFFDQSIKMSYELPISNTKLGMQFSIGVKNIFNAYQRDFDSGPYRDSNYIYGPARPRTLIFGLRLIQFES